jgi:hypothetical protein
MSSSPFAFSMPQQHQVSAFGGPTAIPSPPTAMVYGNSQPLSAHTGVYQAFPHVDSSQVMNASARNQYNQYSNPQGNAGAPYGLNSIFMTSMDTGYPQMSSYQLSHHQQHSQSGQGPTPSNRSPGPMPTSGGGSTAGVMTSMKAQQTPVGHPSMAHQVMGTPNQQAYSQMTHHHTGNMGHHQLPPVGHPNKPAGPGQYTQSALPSQSQQVCKIKKRMF